MSVSFYQLDAETQNFKRHLNLTSNQYISRNTRYDIKLDALHEASGMWGFSAHDKVFFFLLLNILSMKIIVKILQDHVDNHLMDETNSCNYHWLDLGARVSEPDKELPCFSPSFQSQTRSWEWWLWCFCDGGGGDKDEDTSGKDGDCDDNYHALIKSFPCILSISRNCSQDTVKGFSRGEPEWVLGVGNRRGKKKKRSKNSGTGRAESQKAKTFRIAKFLSQNLSG